MKSSIAVLCLAFAAVQSQIVAPNTQVQYHEQDNLGGFSYGYENAATAAVSYVPSAPYGLGGYYNAPAQPVLAYSPPSSQHRIQDHHGQYSFSYSDGASAKLETRYADGSIGGSYAYIDAHGIPQRARYIADHLGFRIAATNLPVGP